ncbi:GH1 family beta-glucosidase [Aeromicrobium duanguangcaii]|uniref:GH1 family beta-glucosidase n=1 Tax=Aeromicrobium duanguangcaii TaxID=2968086 RepID=UPI002017D4E9|nr:GH1 family beta-glucosidase [Aeromicrobium duanguangcaii]MCL3837432.1 GH1 family beta-glucosidase [Aeromicrobium duanguangcaii]
MTGLSERFDPGFLWGVATSAYQIEGATKEDGRGPSIWDTFAARPGMTRRGENGEVAVDHYHRWPEDVSLVKDLGLDAYRFSVAWPRIQPEGRGRVEPRGLAFYDRLVDGLLEAGVQPWPTLFHWDLPQALEDAGGWPVRDTAERFADYAQIVAEALGDRVRHWTTLNEPWCAAFLGYGAGIHAPGRTEPAAALAASHHLNLAHGLAVPRLREGRPEAQVGVTVNLYAVSPGDDTGRHDDAARRIDGLMNRWFLDPLLLGRYPQDVLDDVAGVGGTDVILDEDLATVAAPLDFLGINYYSRHVVAASPWPGASEVGFVTTDRPKTASGWDIDPGGLAEVLDQVRRDYPPIPIYITENGAAFDDDVLSAEGTIDDQDRIDFIDGHLRALADARDSGMDIRGYFAWSLLDNFEWAEGYDKRFGIVHVDFETLVRTPKASALWFAELARSSSTKGSS